MELDPIRSFYRIDPSDQDVAERLKEQLGFGYAFANDLEMENGKPTGQIKGRIFDAKGN